MLAKDMASANERQARQINQEARQNPGSQYAGKLVGIAHGQVIVVAETWRVVVEHLRQVEPDPAQCYCLDASADFDRVDEIPELGREVVGDAVRIESLNRLRSDGLAML